MKVDSRVERLDRTNGSIWKRHLIDWPELERTLALLAFCLFYVALAEFALGYLPKTEVAPVIHPAFYDLAVSANRAIGVFWLGLFLLGAWSRRTGAPYGYISWLLSLSFVLFFCFVLYLMGLYSTPLPLLLGAGLMMSLLLMDRTIVHFGAIVACVVMATVTMLERSGAIPHAPFFIEPPYKEEGGLMTAWFDAVAFASWALLVVIWVIGDNVVTRWRRREDGLKFLSNRDSLTGVANRRHFMDRLREACFLAEEEGRALSLLMFDADHFKSINDQHGHAVGDEVLVALARVITEGAREGGDLVGRLGGEEFALLLPNTELDSALIVAERIRRAAESHEFRVGEHRFTVTVSVGIASNRGLGNAPADLLHHADAMLYRSKREGRNRVSHRAEC